MFYWLQKGYKIQKALDVKKAHIAVSLILLVAETGIEPVTRGFSLSFPLRKLVLGLLQDKISCDYASHSS